MSKVLNPRSGRMIKVGGALHKKLCKNPKVKIAKCPDKKPKPKTIKIRQPKAKAKTKTIKIKIRQPKAKTKPKEKQRNIKIKIRQPPRKQKQEDEFGGGVFEGDVTDVEDPVHRRIANIGELARGAALTHKRRIDAMLLRRSRLEFGGGLFEGDVTDIEPEIIKRRLIDESLGRQAERQKRKDFLKLIGVKENELEQITKEYVIVKLPGGTGRARVHYSDSRHRINRFFKKFKTLKTLVKRGNQMRARGVKLTEDFLEELEDATTAITRDNAWAIF